MAISNITGFGENKNLYYYAVNFSSTDNTKKGYFSFVSNKNISNKNELCQYIWDKGEGATWHSIHVIGSYIDINQDGEKISAIKTVGCNISTYDININYDHYNDTRNTIEGSNYTFTGSTIYIYRYSIL